MTVKTDISQVVYAYDYRENCMHCRHHRLDEQPFKGGNIYFCHSMCFWKGPFLLNRILNFEF